MKFLFNKSAPTVGLDISDNTAELIAVSGTGKNLNVRTQSRAMLPEGIVVGGKIVDKEALARVLTEELFAKALPAPLTPEAVTFGLPESQVYIHTFRHTKSKKNTLQAAIAQTIKEHVPLPETDVTAAHTVVEQTKEWSDVFVVACSSSVLQTWASFFRSLNIVPYIDVEPLAVARGLFDVLPKEPVCVVDIGSATTHVSMYDHKGLRYAQTILIAGDQFTQAIESTLQEKDIAQAETIKREQGLVNSTAAVKESLQQSVDTLFKELQQTFSYSKQTYGLDSTSCLLVGGSSQVPGLLEYASQVLPLSVSFGQPCVTIEEEGFFYIEALGLARRSLTKGWPKQPYIAVPSEKKKKIQKKAASKKELSEGAPITRSSGISRQTWLVIALLAVVAAGTILLAFTFTKGGEQQPTNTFQTYIDQQISASTYVAVVGGEQTSDRVSGQRIDRVVESVEGEAKAILLARELASGAILSGMKLWSEPVSITASSTEVTDTVVSYTVTFVSYQEQQANTLLLEQVKEKNIQNIPYVLDRIELLQISPTDNPDLFELSSVIHVGASERIVEE